MNKNQNRVSIKAQQINQVTGSRKTGSILKRGMQSTLESIDQFGESFRMKLDRQNDSVHSVMGSLCSLVLIFIVCAYAYIKVDVWLHKKDITIMTSTQRKHFDYDYVFNYEQGLSLAFAFTAFDDETENILEPEYGKIGFYRNSWGVRENDESFDEYIEVESHTCTEKELGLSPAEGEGSFYSASEGDYFYIRTYQKKMRCLDKKDLTINGDFNSFSANTLQMRLEKCRESSTLKCKSDEEITQFFRNKYLLVLQNESYFDSNSYGGESIVKTSSLNWLLINTQVQQTFPYKISKTELSLQDKDIDLSDLTELYDDAVFSLDSLPIRSQERDYKVQMEITIEMNLDLNSLSRSGYTPLDVLADIGGIQSLIMSAMSALLGIWNYNNFENYMAQRLYKVKRQDSDQAVNLNRPYFSNIYEWILDSFIQCSYCQRYCRKTRRMQEMQMAREKLSSETNIIEIIKSRRLMKAALDSLISSNELNAINSNVNHKVISLPPSAATQDNRIVYLVKDDESGQSQRPLQDFSAATQTQVAVKKSKTTGGPQRLISSSTDVLPVEGIIRNDTERGGGTKVKTMIRNDLSQVTARQTTLEPVQTEKVTTGDAVRSGRPVDSLVEATKTSQSKSRRFQKTLKARFKTRINLASEQGRKD